LFILLKPHLSLPNVIVSLLFRHSQVGSIIESIIYLWYLLKHKKEIMRYCQGQ